MRRLEENQKSQYELLCTLKMCSQLNMLVYNDKPYVKIKTYELSEFPESIKSAIQKYTTKGSYEFYDARSAYMGEYEKVPSVRIRYKGILDLKALKDFCKCPVCKGTGLLQGGVIHEGNRIRKFTYQCTYCNRGAINKNVAKDLERIFCTCALSGITISALHNKIQWTCIKCGKLVEFTGANND